MDQGPINHQTKLRANCGCKWFAQTTTEHDSGLLVLEQAREHVEKTGHTVELRGEVRPTNRGRA